MTSIIKVDTLQKANGATPTAADLGINTTGTVLQVQHSIFSTTTTISSAASPTSIMSVVITPKSSTSKMVIHACVPRYTPGNASTWSGSGGLYLYEDGVKVQDGEHDGTVTAESQSHTLNLLFVSGSNPSGNPVTYNLRYKPTLGNAGHQLNRAPRKSIMVVTEIDG